MTPSRQGLYNPAFEHDACGVAMVADMHGRRSRDIVDKAITALLNLEHRGAQGAEPHTGDGAGILLQVPDEFLRAIVEFDLPEAGSYATGIAFLPQSSKDAATACEAVEKIAEAEGLHVLGWRDVPTDESSLGALARDAMPTFRQVFISGASGMDLERRAYVVRKRAEHELGTKGPGQDGPGRETVYFPSLSGQTFVYKGMLTTPQLKAFYLDLQDDRLTSALGIVHSRFSTNTFPSWPLAHPFRRIAHNGEINTVTGNENWMRAREALIKTDFFGAGQNLDKVVPICTPGASDTARFDEVLELLHLGGRSLPHAVLMMIPEAWERNESMDPARRAFYQYHASLMEPWDGPASVCFTDGTVVGAVLDRNGLRPSRIWVTSDGLVVMASEAGVLDLDPSTVVKKMRLQPGRMFLVDTAQGRIVSDEEIKVELAAEHPYQDWLDAGLFHLDDLPQGDYTRMPHHRVVLRQQAFGYTYEELNLLVAPMALKGAEPLGSMGTDTPIAVLSQRPRMLFDYFQQLFAQVTNPPLDAIREEVVTSLQGTVGPEGDLLNPKAESCRQIVLPQPILRNHELAKLVNLDPDQDIDGRRHGLRTAVIRCLYPVNKGGEGLREALDNVRAKVSEAIRDGARIIVLSDRESDETDGADPVAAGRRRSAPPPGPGPHPYPGRTGGRVRRRPRGAPHGGAGRLRCRRDQPVHGVRVDRGHARPRGTRRARPRDGAGQLRQGGRQGRAEGDVQDGHLDAGLLHRRPAVPGHRHLAAGARRVLHRLDAVRSAASTSTTSPPTSPPASSWPTWTGPTSGRTANSRSAVNTSGAARASTTCSTPTRCSSCSTRPAPGSTRSSRSTPSWSTTRASGWRRCAGC